MLISPAYAQDITGMFGSATQFLPLVLIFVVFYFLLIRPQQQKQKEMRQMLSALKRGDRVVTGGGIIGTVQRVPMVADKDGKQVASNEIEVEIAPNIRVTVLRDTISSVVRPTAANDAKPVKEKASARSRASRAGSPRQSGRGARDLGRLQLRLGEFVVRQLVHPVLQIVRPAIAEVQVVAVLPHVAAEQHLALAGGERVGAVRRPGHLQLAVRADAPATPSRSRTGRRRRP